MRNRRFPVFLRVFDGRSARKHFTREKPETSDLFKRDRISSKGDPPPRYPNRGRLNPAIEVPSCPERAPPLSAARFGRRSSIRYAVFKDPLRYTFRRAAANTRVFFDEPFAGRGRKIKKPHSLSSGIRFLAHTPRDFDNTSYPDSASSRRSAFPAFAPVAFWRGLRITVPR